MNRWHYLFERFLALMLLAILALVLLMSCAGCGWRVPVASAPAKDAQGEPVVMPVAVQPRQASDGKAIPIPVIVVEPIPVAKDERFADPLAKPVPLPDAAPGWGWVEAAITAVLVALGLGGTGWALRLVGLVRQLRTGLALTANLADQVAEAPDDDAVKQAKKSGQAAQLAAGVWQLIQSVRGKV